VPWLGKVESDATPPQQVIGEQRRTIDARRSSERGKQRQAAEQRARKGPYGLVEPRNLDSAAKALHYQMHRA
jgi:hypothetical protein